MESLIETIKDTIITDTVSGLIVAALIGILACILGRIFSSRYSNASKMREYGIREICENGIWEEWRFKRLIAKAEEIKIYCNSDTCFFRQKVELICDRLCKNKNCDIHIIWGCIKRKDEEQKTTSNDKGNQHGEVNKNSEVSKNGKRNKNGRGNKNSKGNKKSKSNKNNKGNNNRDKSSQNSGCRMNIQNKNVETKVNPDMFFLPYLIVRLKKEKVSFLSLTTPESAQEAMIIVSRVRYDDEGRNMTEELNAHFEAARNMTDNGTNNNGENKKTS